MENNEPILACDLNRYPPATWNTTKVHLKWSLVKLSRFSDTYLALSTRWFMNQTDICLCLNCIIFTNVIVQRIYDWKKSGRENIEPMVAVSLCISGIVTILVAQWPEIRQIATEQWHDLEIIQQTHLSHSLLGLAKVPATSFLSQFTILVL